VADEAGFLAVGAEDPPEGGGEAGHGRGGSGATPGHPAMVSPGLHGRRAGRRLDRERTQTVLSPDEGGARIPG
jgi:hypothetical protein